MLGFAAGVMMAACVWGLLIPAFQGASAHPLGLLFATFGFAAGLLLLISLDHLLPHLHARTDQQEGPVTRLPRSFLLVLAVALHNIPEGMAMGVALGAALSGPAGEAGAIAMGLGIAMQNLPEGAAVTFPLINEGVSVKKSILFGQISGLAEPIAALAGVFLAMSVEGALPALLCFAAGAMLYVIVEELIPQSQTDTNGHAGTLGCIGGFWIMAIIAVMLG